MYISLVEIRSVTSEIRREKKKERKKKERKPTAVKYKPFGIAMPCGLIIIVDVVLFNKLKRMK